MAVNFARKPCSECPWRRDVAPGRFCAARYEALASTAEDMSRSIFACHKSKEGGEFACAGFLLRGAVHNLSVRLAIMRGEIKLDQISDGGHPLFDNYRQVALANGARPSSLSRCRIASPANPPRR